jgi:hypothetical protein
MINLPCCHLSYLCHHECIINLLLKYFTSYAPIVTMLLPAYNGIPVKYVPNSYLISCPITFVYILLSSDFDGDLLYYV